MVSGVGQAPAADGISEIEQSGPFVLDDGEGNWQTDDDAAAEPAVGDEAEVVAVGAEDAVGDGNLLFVQSKRGEHCSDWLGNALCPFCELCVVGSEMPP